MRFAMRAYPGVGTAIPLELAKHKILRERLLAEIPEIDEETLANTLEGITDLRETLAEVIRSARDG